MCEKCNLPFFFRMSISWRSCCFIFYCPVIKMNFHSKFRFACVFIIIYSAFKIAFFPFIFRWFNEFYKSLSTIILLSNDFTVQQMQKTLMKKTEKIRIHRSSNCSAKLVFKSCYFYFSAYPLGISFMLWLNCKMRTCQNNKQQTILALKVSSWLLIFFYRLEPKKLCV